MTKPSALSGISSAENDVFENSASTEQSSFYRLRQNVLNGIILRNPTSILFMRFLSFAISFSLAESALVTSVSFAARLFGTPGSQSVSALYFSYAIGTLFANQAVGSKCAKNRLRPALVGGQFGLLCFHLASLAAIWNGRETEEGGAEVGMSNILEVLLMLSAIVSGLSAGVAWAAAGAFITKTALAVSSLHKGMENEKSSSFHHDIPPLSIESSSTAPLPPSKFHSISDSIRNSFVSEFLSTEFHHLAGNLNSLFNVIMLLTILGGHIFSYYSLRDNTFEEITTTYVILSIVAFVGAVIMMVLVHDPIVSSSSTLSPKPSANENESNSSIYYHHYNPKSLLFAIRLTLQTPQLSTLTGTHIASGFMEGLVLCYVNANLVSEPSQIGILTAAKTIGSAITSPIFAVLGNTTRFGRVNVLIVGSIGYCLAASLTVFVKWRDGGGLGVLLCLYVVAGIGYSTWQGTAGGALLSEIAAALTKRTVIGLEGRDEVENDNGDDEDGQSNIIVTAAFSGCKVLSGTSTSVAFLVFSKPNVSFVTVMILCYVAIVVGLCQVVYGRYGRLWDSMLIRNEGSSRGGGGKCAMISMENKGSVYGSVPVASHDSQIMC